jgi:DNA-directed RNA polymerase specialized sigma24 family protein
MLRDAATDVPLTGLEADGDPARARRRTRPADALEQLFDDAYPAAVGIARRVLDPDRRVPESSLPVAERIAQEAFARLGVSTARRGRTAAVAALVARVADGCIDQLVGHPGSVEVHPELLGPDLDVDGRLSLAELQEALCDLRRRDRRVGLLTIGAGLSPLEAATALGLPLDETLRCLARVGTRLADGRRVGVAPLPGSGAR